MAGCRDAGISISYLQCSRLAGLHPYKVSVRVEGRDLSIVQERVFTTNPAENHNGV